MLRIRGHHGDAADQDAHARIGDAIAARDPRTAGALTREHLDTVTRLFG